MVIDRTQEPPPSDSQSTSAALDVLGDPKSRQILGHLAHEPMVIPELVDELDIPRATAYRKANALRTAGLVSERSRLDPSDAAVSEYTARVGNITVSLAGDGPALQLSLQDGQRRLMTDGGQSPEAADDGQKRLKELFCDVAGTDEVTERQETDNRRFVPEQGEEPLAVDVADVAREDGLDDTLPKPDPDGSG